MKKIGNSFKGILGGFVFILAAVVVLWWNEGNNVKNLKTTAELSDTYIQVSSEKVDPANEGKLIATNGKLIYEEELIDSIFNVKVVAPYMERVVEVFQWEEETETDDNDNTVYRYKKDWHSEIIDSSEFHEKGHENNVVKPYNDEIFVSNSVKLGAFTLTSEQVKNLDAEKNITEFDNDKITGLGYKVFNNYITNSADYSNPQIGDVRISFRYNDSKDASVLAVQTGNTFTSFVSKVGKSVNRIMDGIHSGEEIINKIKQEDKMIKWILRAAGVLLCVIGIATILKPISTITSYIPILGSIVGGAVGLISFILGLAISLVVIAVAWIRFRPVVGFILLAVVVALIVLLSVRGKNKPATEEKQEQ